MGWRAAALLLFGARLFAQDAALAGVVVDATTGRPLSGVHVRVFSSYLDGPAVVYGAMSDSAGRFSIAKVRPGSYFYLGERVGYLTVRRNAGLEYPSLTVRAGEQVADFKLEMTMRAVIAGRVIDELGDPAQGATVSARLLDGDASVGRPARMTEVADDHGDFRIVVGPGKYQLIATSPVVGNTYRPAEIRTDGSPLPDYAPTYYPNSPTPDRATPVDVAAGAETSGIEIRLARTRAGPNVEVSVSGVSPGSRTRVMMYHGESPDKLSYYDQNRTYENGRLEFRNLPAGYYRLEAEELAQRPAFRSPAVEFTAASAPSLVELRVAPGMELTGVVEMDGGALAGRRTARLLPIATGGPYSSSALTGDVEPDGRLRFAAVFPGKYRVAIEPAPENAYVGSVQLGDGVATADELDLTRGVGKLRVALRGDGAEIRGGLLDKDGARIVNTMAHVLLIRDSGQAEMNVQVTPEGTYRLTGIRPGKYRLLAKDQFRPGGDRAGEAIEVKSGDRIRKDVRVADAAK